MPTRLITSFVVIAFENTLLKERQRKDRSDGKTRNKEYKATWLP